MPRSKSPRTKRRATRFVSEASGESKESPKLQDPLENKPKCLSPAVVDSDKPEPLALVRDEPPVERQVPKERYRWTWYNEAGQGPVARFLNPDEGNRTLPTMRVLLMLTFGFLLSAGVIWLSEDEFFMGTSEKRGRALEDFPVHIAFRDVGCHIHNVGDVLRNVTGYIPPGKLTGMLGRSGSGKTLFSMQLLGRGKRHCSAPARGMVYLNGQPRSLEAFTDRVGHVPQDDILYGELTVEESIVFSAQWRLPRSTSPQEISRIVNETIDILHLHSVRHNRIGNMDKRGISGGERRRVSIALELVAKPSVVIADEPTTGLDGANAYHLIKTLRRFVDQGKGTIVAILHQPSERIFELLHHIILMAQGSVVYSGSPQGCIEFLKECGFEYLGPVKDPQKRSASEFVLDVLGGMEKSSLQPSTPNGVDDETRTAQTLFHAWQQKLQTDRVWDMIERDMIEYSTREKELLFIDEDSAHTNQIHPSSFWVNILSSFGLFDHCSEPSHQADVWCVVFLGTPFPVLPKPGLRKQVHIWFWLMIKITWRKGLFVHALVTNSLAFSVAFVRSFNQAWSRRPHANFVLSIIISLLGMLSSVYMDDIAPVQRAADSGMILAAHELANIAHTLVVGWVTCHWFTLSYFLLLWLRTGVYCCTPFRPEKYYEFAHILHVQYLVASGVGSAVLAVTSHDVRSSFVLCIGLLMFFHMFALFSPNKNQAERDSKILYGKLDISPIVLYFARWSYVRYANEALMLWEPDVDNDRVGRNFTLKYFSWVETNTIKDLTWMCALWMLAMASRFTFFFLANVNAYNTAFDIPLFLVFLIKILSLHLTSLIMFSLVHEFYISWKNAANRTS